MLANKLQKAALGELNHTNEDEITKTEKTGHGNAKRWLWEAWLREPTGVWSYFPS
jgi:hypothetical protein